MVNERQWKHHPISNNGNPPLQLNEIRGGNGELGFGVVDGSIFGVARLEKGCGGGRPARRRWWERRRRWRRRRHRLAGSGSGGWAKARARELVVDELVVVTEVGGSEGAAGARGQWWLRGSACEREESDERLKMVSWLLISDWTAHRNRPINPSFSGDRKLDSPK